MIAVTLNDRIEAFRQGVLDLPLFGNRRPEPHDLGEIFRGFSNNRLDFPHRDGMLRRALHF